MILGLIFGALWFTAFFAAHLVVIRIAPTEVKPQMNQRVFLAGVVGVAVSLWLARGSLGYSVLCGELVYIGLFISYMPFYYTVVASLSVQTLVMLGRTTDGRLPIAVLRGRFVSRGLVGDRLATMVVNGFLVEGPNGYALARKGRLVARVFAFIKRFWKLGAGG